MPRKFLLLFLFLLLNSGTFAQEILLGSVLPLKGPTAELGIGLKNGYDSHFKIWNEEKGKKLGINIKVISRDDQYEPTSTYRETFNLVKSRNVFALFSQVGTPTTESIREFLKKENMPLFGLLSGAKLFRQTDQKTFFHLRASYEQELERLLNYFLKTQKKNFFIVHQSDSFGGSGKALIMKLLEKNKLTLSGECAYQRNKFVDKNGIDTLLKSSSDVVIFVGTYGPFSAFIKDARKAGYKGEFATVSFVGTKGLIKVLDKSEEVVMAQIMPNPENRKLAIVRSYQEAMKKNGFTEFDYGSFEGYLYALAFTDFVEKAPRPFERQSFFQKMREYKTDLQGIKIDFTHPLQVARDDVYLVKIKQGKIYDLD